MLTPFHRQFRCQRWASLRRSFLLFGAGLAWASLGGCTNLVEGRVVTAFSAALNAENMADLRAVSSDKLDAEVADQPHAQKALALLNLPKGEHKVLKVRDEDESVKVVTVEVQNKSTGNQKVYYTLKKNPTTGEWEVDEWYLNRESMKSGKAVSQDVQLLTAYLQFLDAWHQGARDAVLATATDEFSALLADLDPEQLSAITRRLTDGHKLQQRPRISVAEDSAEALGLSVTGDLIVKFERMGHGWKVSDVAFDSKQPGEDVGSVRQLASVATTAGKFLKAYRAGSRPEIKSVVHPRLFDECLAAADLSIVPLPEMPDLSQRKKGTEISADAASAYLVWQVEGEIYRLNFENTAPAGRVPNYVVQDITIFELKSQQNKRLTAVFASRAVMQLFHEALVRKDLKNLQLNSTQDFGNRVWSRISPTEGSPAAALATFNMLTPLHLPPEAPQILSTSFKGAVTEITVNHGDVPVTYVLRTQNGKLLVDDLLTAGINRPESVKQTTELLIPVMQFASSYRNDNLSVLRANSARDFNRMIWLQLDHVPALNVHPSEHFSAGLTQVKPGAEEALVVFGDENYGAKVVLSREREQYVVSDIILISGVEERQRIGLKMALRLQVSSQGVAASSQGREVIQPASAEVPADEETGFQPTESDYETHEGVPARIQSASSQP